MTGAAAAAGGGDAPPRLWASWLVAGALVAAWIAAAAIGVDVTAPGAGELIATGGNYGPRTLDGQPWRLVTAAFVHAGVVHLAVNVIALAALGPVLERRAGRAGGAAVMLGATVVAGAVSAAWSPYAVSVGASGALAGVCGALAVALVVAPARFSPRARRGAAVAVAATVAWGVILAWRYDGVDHAAHAAGLVAGAAIGALAIGATRARSTGALLGVAVAVAVAAAVVATARPPSDLRAVARDVEAIERRFDAVVRGAGLRPDGPRLARTIDADVIAPLRAAAARIRVDPRMPPRDRARAAALTGYAAARLRALELFVRYLDTGDASLQADIRAASAEADAALAAAR